MIRCGAEGIFLWYRILNIEIYYHSDILVFHMWFLYCFRSLFPNLDCHQNCFIVRPMILYKQYTWFHLKDLFYSQDGNHKLTYTPSVVDTHINTRYLLPINTIFRNKCIESLIYVLFASEFIEKYEICRQI